MENSYVVGVDLGQSSDPTALCVARVEHRQTGRLVEDGMGALAAAWGYSPSVERVPEVAPHFELLDLQRYPLGTPYPAIVRDVARLLEYLATPPSPYIRRHRQRGEPWQP